MNAPTAFNQVLFAKLIQLKLCGVTRIEYVSFAKISWSVFSSRLNEIDFLSFNIFQDLFYSLIHFHFKCNFQFNKVLNNVQHVEIRIHRSLIDFEQFSEFNRQRHQLFSSNRNTEINWQNSLQVQNVYWTNRIRYVGLSRCFSAFSRNKLKFNGQLNKLIHRRILCANYLNILWRKFGISNVFVQFVDFSLIKNTYLSRAFPESHPFLAFTILGTLY